MKIMIPSNCLWADKLLLCLLVFHCLGCSSLRRLDHRTLKSSHPTLQIAISESDFPLFIQRIQELNLVPMDLKQGMQIPQNSQTEEFWVTFRFATKNALLMARSEILSTGMVRRMNINN